MADHKLEAARLLAEYEGHPHGPDHANPALLQRSLIHAILALLGGGNG
jgi:hypothetical protein